jgi:(S)-sulfolactate dehydrogenase
VVGRLGVGLDNLDMAGCEARGMRVLPATGANALSVAEYVITTAMLLLRGAYAATPAIIAGQWPRAALTYGRETAGKKLGIVGFGSIGQTVARLGQGLGMEVSAFDAVLAPGHPVYAQTGVRAQALDDLIGQSDVVTLHVPLLDSTRKLMNTARIASMKKGAVLINTARGPVVDASAVADALRGNHLGGAALDVFDEEPPSDASIFAGCPNLILTPHISGQTAESNDRVCSMVAARVLEALA